LKFASPRLRGCRRRVALFVSAWIEI
jgi:hypothetical protein